MSGICASVRLDGGLADATQLAPVLAQMAVRGPDGMATMAQGPAALGHALLATTPEARTAPLLLRHAPTGCMVSADVRLDNRADLIAALGLDPAGRVIGDAELILEAYLAWGLDCPARLLGDFAFVLWDPRCQRLFAARDKAGMRQLIYAHLPGRIFACATDVDALLAHTDVPRRINEARIADFLEQLEAIDHTSTFYLDALRLPPAHALVVERGDLRQWRYWQLTAPGPVLRLGSDAAYDEAFLEVFTKAVSARLRASGPVGAMLSGGIDSGSVTAIAARLLHQAGAPPLPTFSGVDDDPGCKESACIRDAIAAVPRIAPHIISLGDAADFRADIARLTAASSDPFDGHMTLIRAIYRAGQQAGITVMLDGVSGDTTLATGNMVAFHLRRGRVLAAWAEARAQAAIRGGAQSGPAAALATAARRMIAPAPLRRMRRASWQQAEAARQAAASIVNPALAARIDMAARRQAHARHVALDEGCDQVSQARRMLHPYAVVGRERYDRVAGEFGIEPRDPFLDVRLLEFALTLPADQLAGKGWAKLLLRRAMAGAVPDSVQWKRGRDHVGWRFTEVCLRERLDALDDKVIANLGRYADLAPVGDPFALQCSEGRVVTETDLLYLGDWFARI